MKIDVCLTPLGLTEEATDKKIVAVVDVLRACSTIVTALANGAREVLPVADRGEAGRVSAHLDKDICLLGGEHEGQRIEGYGVGNSPLEFSTDVVDRKIVVLSTTNGTPTFALARSASAVIAACFLNLSRVVGYFQDESERLNNLGQEVDILLLCAGQNGRPALEDVLCAGMIIHRLSEPRTPELSDSATIALTQYRSNQKRLARALFNCSHTQQLIEMGLADDVAYCARVDSIPVLPTYQDNRLLLDSDDKRRPDENLSMPSKEEELA